MNDKIPRNPVVPKSAATKPTLKKNPEQYLKAHFELLKQKKIKFLQGEAKRNDSEYRKDLILEIKKLQNMDSTTYFVHVVEDYFLCIAGRSCEHESNSDVEKFARERKIPMKHLVKFLAKYGTAKTPSVLCIAAQYTKSSTDLGQIARKFWLYTKNAKKMSNSKNKEQRLYELRTIAQSIQSNKALLPYMITYLLQGGYISDLLGNRLIRSKDLKKAIQNILKKTKSKDYDKIHKDDRVYDERDLTAAFSNPKIKSTYKEVYSKPPYHESVRSAVAQSGVSVHVYNWMRKDKSPLVRIKVATHAPLIILRKMLTEIADPTLLKAFILNKHASFAFLKKAFVEYLPHFRKLPYGDVMFQNLPYISRLSKQEKTALEAIYKAEVERRRGKSSK